MNRRFGLVLLLTALIFMMGCISFAEVKTFEIAEIPGTRLEFPDEEADQPIAVPRPYFEGGNTVNRLVFASESYDPNTGVYNVVIDDTNTDWEMILSGGGGLPYVNVVAALDNPADDLGEDWEGHRYSWQCFF